MAWDWGSDSEHHSPRRAWAWSLSESGSGEEEGSVAPAAFVEPKRPRGRPRKHNPVEPPSEEPHENSSLQVVWNPVWNNVARPIGNEFYQLCSKILNTPPPKKQKTGVLQKVIRGLRTGSFFTLSPPGALPSIPLV